MFESNVGIRAEYQLSVKKNDTGEVVQQTGISKNIITNFAFNSDKGLFYTGFAGLTLAVTTVSDEPTVENHLCPSNLIKTTTKLLANTDTTEVNEDDNYWITKLQNERRFEVGMLEGTYHEVGLLSGAGNVYENNEQKSSFISRTLIKDHRGIPTPIVVAKDEFVDCVVTLYFYVKKESRGTLQMVARDNSLIKNIGYRILTGKGKGDSYGMRYSQGDVALVQSVEFYSDAFFQSGLMNEKIGTGAGVPVPAEYRDHVFNLVPQSISNTRGVRDNVLYYEQGFFLTILHANFPIRIMRAVQSIFGQRQITWIIFDEPIEKTADMIMDFTLTATISRKT